MLAIPEAPQVAPMAESQDPGTRTVRIATELAKKLQTISALKDEMGERFKPVEFLTALVRGPIVDLYEQTMKDFASFKAKGKKRS